jgi:hypothetical protein
MKAVASQNLIDRIEALPPDKKAEVEDFVAFLAGRSRTTATAPAASKSEDLLRRMDERRERLRREVGLFDSVEALRELRDEE